MNDEVGNNSNAEQFVEKLDKFSSNKLKNKEDLTRIINTAFKYSTENLIKDASFSAKYIQGLVKIIRRGDTDIEEDYFIKIKKELADNLEKIKSNLKEIMKGESSFITNIFNEKYFELSQDAMNNLLDLCDDLGWVKVYLNEYKEIK